MSPQDLVGMDADEAAARLREAAFAQRADGAAWTSEVGRSLAADVAGDRSPAAALRHVKDTWQLTNGELGHVLGGVSKQSVGAWLTRGVPADRQPEVAALADVAALLERYVRRERIVTVVRRHDAHIGGRSILEHIAADGAASALAYVRHTLDYERLNVA